MHLRNIGHIRKLLTTDATKSLVNALVTSRLDYANAVLYGVSAQQIERIQKVQNSAARLITFSPRRNHISPVIRELHWLKIEKRIRFKTLCLPYRAMNGLSPVYISQMLKPYSASRDLRSNNKRLLVIPRTRAATYGSRHFAVASATLWNTLPDNIKKAKSLDYFKRMLKGRTWQPG